MLILLLNLVVKYFKNLLICLMFCPKVIKLREWLYFKIRLLLNTPNFKEFVLPMNASSGFIFFFNWISDLEWRKTNPGRVDSDLRRRQGRVRRPATAHRRKFAAARIDVGTGHDGRRRHSKVKLRRGDVRRLFVARQRLHREPVPIDGVELEDGSGVRSQQVVVSRHWRRANVEQKALG